MVNLFINLGTRQEWPQNHTKITQAVANVKPRNLHPENPGRIEIVEKEIGEEAKEQSYDDGQAPASARLIIALGDNHRYDFTRR